ncbi:hypothetical protein CPB83DRAFT_148912 [Crepidotus variabilis]|uniref:Uncharacterized protein n=1 Tax=Crepidotus variabilis TaxID=179855 RepID=A0A9P6JRN1_9AGAR|nr:hypothetical protein CPB83DRAFT_148912 [Crepidotus variabilis]
MSEHPLRDFFDKWSDTFTYDPSEPSTSEFRRLCREQRWRGENPAKTEAESQFRYAITMQFNRNYGTDVNSLESWQRLCENVRINPIPDNVKEARQKVKQTHVNLVDLTDGYDGGREIIIFPTEEALAAYTRSNGRFFPKEEAYAGGVLKYLLRHILNPYLGGGRGRGRGNGV